MSDDIHIDGHNEKAGFEQEDLSAKPILIFLLALIVGCLLVALILRGMYSYLDAYHLVALMCVGCLPLILVAGKPKRVGPAVARAAATESH